jgi:hypothetical protein
VNGQGDLEVEMLNVETDDFDYEISNKAAPGWVNLMEFPYKKWLESSGNVYILRRQSE